MTNLSSEWKVGGFFRMKKTCPVNEFCFVYKKILEFKLVHDVCKYFPASFLNQLIYANVQCREPKKVPVLMKTTWLCSSRNYYSMVKRIYHCPWYIQSLPPPPYIKLKQPSRFWRFKRWQREAACGGGGGANAEIFSRVGPAGNCPYLS